MKHLTRPSRVLATLALLTTPCLAYTEPVGYETLVANDGQSNLLALRLHDMTRAAGSFESISGTVLVDGDANFETVLSIEKSYVVELTGGPVDGRVLDVVSFTDNTLMVAEPLPAASDILYRIREVPRLSTIINPLETLATDDFNPDHADLILIPIGDGKFNPYFCSSRLGHMGYFNAATGCPEDPLLHYTEAFFYLRRASSPLNIVVSGTVKSANTLLMVTDTFNYVGSAYPIITLGDTSLELSMHTGTADTADIVWLQGTEGEYNRYYYSDGSPPLTVGWRLIDAPPGTEDNDQGAVSIHSGMIIQRRALAPYHALLTPPDWSL